jgi:acyl-CoA synthetase (AMP-forming)/AMP-acid ligase II
VAAPAAVEAGEDEVAVFAVLVPDGALDEDAVRAWCIDRLPAFARPEYVEIVAELPVTPSGKIRKAELRDRIAARTTGSAGGRS